MKTARLGTAGPEISVIGYGAWEAGGMWGSNPPDEQLVAAMRTAFDEGVTWVDTAEVYGPGRSEELVGKAVEGRDDVLVFTKVAPQLVIGGQTFGSGLDSSGVRAGAEGSLKRLGRDVIDLYQLHAPDPRIPVEDSWKAMAQLVEDGLVRWIGVSNFDRELIERCERIRHVDSLQPQFSILSQDAAQEAIPLGKSNGTGVICYGPLGFGLLTGTITAETAFEPDDWRAGQFRLPVDYYEMMFAPGKIEKNLEVVDSLRPIADRLGISLAQLALTWTFRQDGVTGAITGSRSAAHIAESAAAGAIVLSAEDLDEIAAATAVTVG